MMLPIPGVLTREQVAQMRKQLAQANWQDGRATVGAQGARVKQNRQLPTDAPLSRELGQIILTALTQNPLFHAAALPLRTCAPLFNIYTEGEHYGAHIDGAIRQLPEGGLLRTDVSSTLFLCDADEYEGGELIINDSYGTHEVKLDAGDLIVYPSSSIHKIEPVTKGSRICSFFWSQSMVRDDNKRTMLLELDQAISGLRTKLGDCEEVLGLTAHYHNLLRMWAEV